ncbi:MAG: hypothetical protein ACMUJM_02045 [bacterium]
MMKKRRFQQLILFTLLIGLFITGVYILVHESRDTRTNPYEYTLEDYETIPPGMVHFIEIQKIPFTQKELYALAVDPDDTIYVAADRSLIICEENGKKAYEFPLEREAYCLSVDPNQYIYCGMGDHVEIYDRAGRQRSVWSSLGEQAMITSCALFSDHVFIADAGNRLLWNFDSSGRLKCQIGRGGKSGSGQQFVIPSPFFDVSVSPRHTLLVTNPGRLRIEEYTFEGEQISFWGGFSMRIEGFAGCCNPTHIAVRHDGSIITSEKGIPRVKLYEPDGRFIGVIATPAMLEDDSGSLDCAVNSKDEVLVLDPKARVIRIFSEKRGKERGASL